MITEPMRTVIFLCTVFIASMPAFLVSGSLRADENPASKKSQDSQRLEKRIQRLEKRLQQQQREQENSGVVLKEREPSMTGRRFQMMRVGERLVILDSDTGKTRIIEGNFERPIQNVEVGNALVVVTVLGRVMPTPASNGDPVPTKSQP